MKLKLPIWLGHIVAFISSTLAAFFGVFNVLFSDIFGFSEKAGAVLYVFVIYLVLSWLMNWLWPERAKAWRLWLVIPGGLSALLVIVSDLLFAAYPIFVLLGMIGGTWLGWLVFQRRSGSISQ